MIIPQAPAASGTDGTPAASEEADAAFLQMAYPGSLVWWGSHTGEWWGMLPGVRELMHGPTVDGVGEQFAAWRPAVHHAPP